MPPSREAPWSRPARPPLHERSSVRHRSVSKTGSRPGRPVSVCAGRSGCPFWPEVRSAMSTLPRMCIRTSGSWLLKSHPGRNGTSTSSLVTRPSSFPRLHDQGAAIPPSPREHPRIQNRSRRDSFSSRTVISARRSSTFTSTRASVTQNLKFLSGTSKMWAFTVLSRAGTSTSSLPR